MASVNGAQADLVIGLDAGHGGPDRGACHNGIVESVWNMAFCRLLKSELDCHDIECVLLRSRDNEDVSLLDRGRRSHDAHCDFVFSFHVNAAQNPNWHGLLAFHWPTSTVGRRLGNFIMRSAPPGLYKPGWDSFAATSEPGPDDDWLQRPRNVIAPHDDAVLVEVGYCSNPKDSELLKDPLVIDGLVGMMKSTVAYYRRM